MSLASRSQNLRWCPVVLAGLLLVLAFGCAGKSERNGGDGGDDDGGPGGTSNGGAGGTTPPGGVGATTGGANGKGGDTGGSATTGGSSGEGGTSSSGGAGSSGKGGTSGMTGGTASGGSAGTAGTAGAECNSTDDCYMVSDCCGCRAVPVGSEPTCLLPCERDSCAEDGIGMNEAECVFGQCVISRSCDRGTVTCRAAEPECASGTVPSVVENCWGPCIAPTDCASVTDCSDCGDSICVEFQAWAGSYSCRATVPGCNAGNYCECLGVCPFACVEREDAVSCSCPVC